MLHALKSTYKIHFAHKILLCSVVLISVFSLTCLAGKKENKKAVNPKSKARQMEREQRFQEAIAYYQMYITENPDDLKSTYALANLYYKIRDYSNAANLYDTLLLKNDRKFTLAYFYRGNVAMNLEKYDEAIESFSTFRKEYRGTKDRKGYRRIAWDKIESAEWAKIHKDSIADINLHALTDVNGSHIEFSPIPVSNSELIYGSYLPDSTQKNVYRQLYVAHYEQDTWKKTGILEGPVNHPDQHTGNAAFSYDGNRMYFTRCHKNWQNNDICEIYMSEKVNGEWQEPVKLPFPVNNETNTSTQPALGYNTRRETDILYFVSDRDGTRGGLDIWMTEYDSRSDAYREPRNLGRNINSAGDDCCPFYDKNTGSLFFSSNGRLGFGGFDIYRAMGSGRNWTEGENLPKPINSSYDDTYYASLNGTEGYFTSNRPGSLEMDNGSCCEDIFYFKYNKCISLPATGKVFNITNSDIYDLLNTKYNQNLEYVADNEALANIPVKLFRLDDKTGEEQLINETRTDAEGKYNFILERNRNYTVVVENYGYFEKRINIHALDFNCDETIDIKETGINYLPEITVIFNIYYEHDKSRLTDDAQHIIDTTLLPLFDLYPTARVEIGSHTDFTGSDAYNVKLSQRRSESVVNYLIEKGIDKNRLVAKGYGEFRPIAPNMNADGSDNPEGRQLNRRSEFKIIGSLNTFNEQDYDE